MQYYHISKFYNEIGGKLKIITYKTKNHHTGSVGPGRKMKLNKLNHCSSSPGLGGKRDD